MLPKVTLPIKDIRVNVVARVRCKSSSASDDIIDAAKTNDNIVRALDVITAPASKAGYAQIGKGRSILITAAYSDHFDDSSLGPHGHHPGSLPGWAIDFVPVSDDELLDADRTKGLLRELIAQNYYITKVGCPGRYAQLADLQTLARQCGVLLFTDEGTGAHVHIQSAEDSILAGLAKNS